MFAGQLRARDPRRCGLHRRGPDRLWKDVSVRVANHSGTVYRNRVPPDLSDAPCQIRNNLLILEHEDTNYPFQTLSKDPYGIYALVLTPTRELAFQIADQFKVAGSPIGLRVSIVVGGRDMVEQVQH